jgi:hypothetical protein
MQSLKSSVSILFCRPDKDVEIIGSTHVAMHIHRNAAHHGKFNRGCGERGEESNLPSVHRYRFPASCTCVA